MVHRSALLFFLRSGYGWGTDVLNHCEEHASENIKRTFKTITLACNQGYSTFRPNIAFVSDEAPQVKGCQTIVSLE